MPREKREVVRLELRLPPDVHGAIAASAEANERSLNAEIIVRLRESMDARATPKKATTKKRGAK